MKKKSKILEIQKRLQDTSALIAKFERAIVDNPDSPSLLATVESLAIRQNRLEQHEVIID